MRRIALVILLALCSALALVDPPAALADAYPAPNGTADGGATAATTPPTEATTPPPAPSPPTPLHEKTWFWSLVGGTITMVPAVIVLGVKLSSPRDAPEPTDIPHGFHLVTF